MHYEFKTPGIRYYICSIIKILLKDDRVISDHIHYLIYKKCGPKTAVQHFNR